MMEQMPHSTPMRIVKLSVGRLSIILLGLLVAELLCPLTGGCNYSTGAERGEYLLFERNESAHRMYPDGSGVRLIARHGTKPVCSPGGEWIAFTHRGDNPPGRDLFWTDPWGNSMRRLTRGFSIVTRMSISRDGIGAFVPGYLGMQNLYSIRIGEGVTLQHTTTGFHKVTLLGWSPNGKQLAFGAEPKGNGLQMSAYYILDYGARNITPIPNAEMFYPSLSWSPDGSSVALLSTGIEIIDVKTNSRRQLPRPPGVMHNLTWSPDGQYLALARVDEECHRFSGNIYVIRISDNTEKKVSKHSFRCRTYSSPAWSLDGKQLVFLASRSKPDMDFTPFTKTLRDNIYLVNRDGSSQVNLSGNEDVADTHPMWCREAAKQ